MEQTKVLLMILDGFGLRESGAGNAVKEAKTPNLDRIFSEWPTTTLGASGLDVGLPAGQMGNSEVGHTNMGAGRIVYQELTRITKAIEDGGFDQNPVLLDAMRAVRETGTLHLMGLLSDGGVHSHIEHLYALLDLAKKVGVRRAAVHCFLDGRDVSPSSGAGFVEELERRLVQNGCGEIATLGGRYYAMDRDNRWERVEAAWRAVALGEGAAFTDPVQAVRTAYENGTTDEFIPPMVREGYWGMQDGDAVIYFNFRPDRARELTRTLADPAFSAFPARKTALSHFITMTSYDDEMPGVEVAFQPERISDTLEEVIERSGLSQLRIAETEKYAHVTFFFGCGKETPPPHEDRILVPSPKVATYDLKPEMSADEVTERLLRAMAEKPYDFIVLNFANCDMVGHTGIFDAAVKAVETVDRCAGRVIERARELGYTVLVTADHGNAEEMRAEDGSPMTAHTTNRVPFAVVGQRCTLREGGRLADIAPTVLELLGVPKPSAMTGESLLYGEKGVKIG